jgi:hypothetical protein
LAGGEDFYWQSRFGYTFHSWNFGKVQRLAIVTFRNPEIPPRYCGFLYDPESEIRPPGKARGLLDKLFHPAKIQPD